MGTKAADIQATQRAHRSTSVSAAKPAPLEVEFREAKFESERII